MSVTRVFRSFRASLVLRTKRGALCEVAQTYASFARMYKIQMFSHDESQESFCQTTAEEDEPDFAMLNSEIDTKSIQEL